MMQSTNCGYDDTQVASTDVATEATVPPDSSPSTTDVRAWAAVCNELKPDQETAPCKVPIETFSGSKESEQSDPGPRIFPAGTMLSNAYRVGDVIGTGGMGQILEAVDTRLGRTVAIKACKPGIPSDYLHVEAKLLGSFCHPSIVSIYDIGSHEGVDFLVMERLYGLSLREHLKRLRGPMSVPEALDILISLCDALGVMHRDGVIHRDLKPANIMLTPGNRPVLLDLGISLREEQTQREWRLAGSPLYMAPEAVQGHAHHPPCPLMDIYSLGCLAYELLTGTVPYRGMNCGFVLAQHLHRETPMVSTSVEVPDHLDRLVAQMMSKTPENRPQSVEAIAAWLRDIRQPRTTEYTQPSLDVLIADDDQDMRVLLGAFVEQCVEGAECRLVADGEAALREIRRRPPDVLLLDLDMPRLNGIELCMLLRGTSHASQTAIVAVSGTTRSEDKELLRWLGVTEFIGKQANITELLGNLRTALRARVFQARQDAQAEAQNS